MAAEARLSIEEYWEQIIKACFLDLEDPVARWREVRAADQRHRDRLNALPIERLHVEGADADLWIATGRASAAGEDGVGSQHPELRALHLA